MNERIRELAREANQSALDAMIKIADKEQALKAYSETYDIKFAQLIVAECVTLADKEAERFSNLNQEYCAMAMDNYRELVQKHFGVEE